MLQNILLIDNDKNFVNLLKMEFGSSGYRIDAAADFTRAQSILAAGEHDLVILDLFISGSDGLDHLRELRSAYPALPVLAITSQPQVRTAVQAMRLGAFDYLAKPIDLDELRMLFERVRREQKIAGELSFLRRSRVGSPERGELIGTSPGITEMKRTADKLVEKNARVILIQGETGTGKEMLAHYIAAHPANQRGKGPFIPVNCATIHTELLESELFGHARGAFTGAQQKKDGLLLLADEGTLLLDEVAELSASAQAKLLRVLEDFKFRPLGGTTDIKVDICLLAATNRDLEKEMAAGRFRQDLYYRLNAVTLTLPPLRDRRGDILLLAEHFLDEYDRVYNKDFKSFSPATQGWMKSYPWPGNTRELRNIIDQGVMMGDGKILDIPSPASGLTTAARKDSPAEMASLEELEKQHIARVLKAVGWNKSKAAATLGLSRFTLRNKIIKYGLKK